MSGFDPRRGGCRAACALRAKSFGRASARQRGARAGGRLRDRILARPGRLASPRPSLDREADLPAEEAQARPNPWLSRPHAHARRPGGDPAAPAEGSQAPHPLMGRSGTPRRRRLSRSGDFDRVFREGRSYGNRYLVVYAFGLVEQGGTPAVAEQLAPLLEELGAERST